MFKNLGSQKVIVFAFDSTTNAPKTGDAANITAYISKDFGSVTQLTDTSATEMDATNAKGYYLFDITQTETNADLILVSGKSSTANIVVVGAPAAIATFPSTGILAPATAGRTLVVDAAGLADANTVKIGPTGSGTAQTARDVGASVLLSAGTGTGQLDFTSGVVKANLVQILATALTETAGQIAAAFKQFFDVGTPTGTMKAITAVASVTGAVGSVTGNVGGNVVGSVASVSGAVGSVTGNVGGNVVGTVASVVGNVGGNVTGTVGGFAAGQGPRVRKNVALTNFMILMTDSTTHAPSTGQTVTVTRSIDGSSFAALAVTTVTEVSGGWYKFNFAAADLNGDTIAVRATASGCDDLDFLIVTNP